MTVTTDHIPSAIPLTPRPLWDDPLTALSAARATHPFKERFSGGRIVFSTGRENDQTGLYYYRERYYHPQCGRFISEDPIGFTGGDVNLYAYVRGNPTGLVDSLGLQAGSRPQATSGAPRLAGRKPSFSCGGVPVEYPVVKNVSSHPRVRQIYGRYQRWWGPVPVIPVCVAKIRPSDLALYSSKGGRDALLLAEGFFEHSSWDQHATIGHELTHLWQNIHMGFVHVPGLPLEDQPLEVHAESVGRAFADWAVGKTR